MSFFHTHHRNGLKKKAFPAEDATSLTERIPLVAMLEEDERQRLYRDMNVFLEEKQFEGCAGLTITREMELAVASQACLLILNIETDYFPGCESILIYPSGFSSYESRPIGRGLVMESEVARIGESWGQGTVILSWDAIRRDIAGLTGRNVVLHEFAHQLDQSDGASDGWPTPMAPEVEAMWLEIMAPAFKTHVASAEKGKHTTIPAYGAKKPAEFYAVFTELFFEQPQSLFNDHRKIYEVLSAYYCQDPRSRVHATGARH